MVNILKKYYKAHYSRLSVLLIDALYLIVVQTVIVQYQTAGVDSL